MLFDVDCKRCSRLNGFLGEVKARYPSYYCKPVPAFGDVNPSLLIVGLAPGMHGANRTGRPFTGDYAGILLYDTLFRFGYASAPESVALEDGLQLHGCRISNAVKCLPPDNKPSPLEILTCNTYLAAEIANLSEKAAILALGTIAHQAVLKALGLKAGQYKFAHAAMHALPGGRRLYDSYHCSRYNTQTRRLTEAMFHAVFRQIQSGENVISE